MVLAMHKVDEARWRNKCKLREIMRVEWVVVLCRVVLCVLVVWCRGFAASLLAATLYAVLTCGLGFWAVAKEWNAP